MGYDGLTIGIETGDDEALRFMDKGYASSDIIRQCQRLDRAGMQFFLSDRYFRGRPHMH